MEFDKNNDYALLKQLSFYPQLKRLSFQNLGQEHVQLLNHPSVSNTQISHTFYIVRISFPVVCSYF